MGDAKSRAAQEQEQSQDTGEESQPVDETSAPAASTFAATDLLFPSNSRRRRLLNRLTGSGSGESATASSSSSTPNGRSSATFNPHAVEFVPSAKMPPKRKASSSAWSGKSTLPAPRTNNRATDQPTINSGDLFGADSIGSLMGNALESILDDDDSNSSDIFELEMQELRTLGQVQNQPAHRRDRLHEAFAVLRNRSNEKSQSTAPKPQRRSVFIFSYDHGTSADALNDSSRIRYLPLCPSSNSTRPTQGNDNFNLTILPNVKQCIDSAELPSMSFQAPWPPEKLPVEIFELVIDYLSRDDVKSMRLVNKEFEQKVSRALFNTSVVPFNTELYDMIDEDARAVNRGSRPTHTQPDKGKGRARDIPDSLADPRNKLHWQNAKDDIEGKVYKGHGLRVFQGFGPHIKRFGMSFEVAEAQLARPHIKKELDHVESYFGSYDWPAQQYTRFANLAGLERTADDTLRMKAAFSHLKSVRELGLSIDSGLGWLNGPEKSVRAQIFDRPSSVFRDSRDIPDRQAQEAEDFWAAIRASHRTAGANENLKEIVLHHKHLSKPPAELRGLQGSRYADSRLWPTIAADKVLTSVVAPSALTEESRHGVIHTTSAHTEHAGGSLVDKSALVPADLRKEQKEWLLETEWAQRAFLECYMLAIIDNPIVFGNVKTLNIPKISSSFLPLLANETFWDALPSLTDVTLHVKPDWRTVEKDDAGFAETTNQNPSEAVRSFYQFILRDRLCLRPSITTLNIGWAAGGEHAEGLFARNSNLLPAPITQLEHSTAINANFGLVFKYVEHLTLTNCWITPPTLAELVRNHAGTQLKYLTLDSVSLTAHPRFPAGNHQQQMAQAMAAMQGFQGGNQPMHAFQALNQQNPQALQQNMQQQVAALQAGGVHWPPLPAFVQGGGFALPPLPPPAPAAGAAPQQPWMQNVGMPPAGLGQGNAAVPPPVIPFAPLPPAPVQNQQAQQQPSHWAAGHREGSWPHLLDDISPGPILSDYLPQPQPWEEQLPERATTNVQSIEFRSCGYCKLATNTTFDQFTIDGNFSHVQSNWFRNRSIALASAMMTANDRYLGRIVQHIPQRELDALLFAWGLTEGWQDRAKAEEAEYDGHLPGGTGRFSGVITKGMAPLSQSEEAPAQRS